MPLHHHIHSPSELDIVITMQNMQIEVLYFRKMDQCGMWSIARHSHSTYEFHFVTRGSCRVICSEEKSKTEKAFKISAGSFYVTGPGLIHTQSFTGEPFTELCLNCSIGLTDEAKTEAFYLYRILQANHFMPVPDRSGCTSLFQRLLEAFSNRRTGYFSLMQSLIAEIITLSVRELGSPEPSEYSVPTRVKKHASYSAKISSYMKTHLYQSVSVKELAAHLNLSEKHLGRIIFSCFGMGTKQFIMQMKFDCAKELLNNQSLTIREISDLLHFSSPYYFSQFFKSFEGYAPQNYRKNIFRR